MWLLGLAFALFFVLLLVRPWRIESFVDASVASPTDASGAAAASAKAEAQLASEYSTFQKWLADFCTTWNDVIQKAQKADQNTQTQDEYIQSLEAKNGIQLYRCTPTWPSKPSLDFIAQNIPADASIFKSTITFMKTETDNIKANTTAALAAGKKEGFVSGSAPGSAPGSASEAGITPGIKPTCQLATDRLTCIFPLGPGGTFLPAQSPAQLAQKLATLNSEIATLQPLYQQVQSNITELNSYVDKVQSGEIFKGVLAPN